MERKVTFTASGARRIIAATRAVERGNRDQSPIKFRQPGDDSGFALRLARVESDWAKDTIQSLTPIYETSCEEESGGSGEPVELEVWNRMFKIKAGSLVEIALALNGCWYVVAVSQEESSGCDDVVIAGHDLSDIEGYSASATQVLGHENGCLRWIDTTTCSSGS